MFTYTRGIPNMFIEYLKKYKTSSRSDRIAMLMKAMDEEFSKLDKETLGKTTHKTKYNNLEIIYTDK